MTPKFKPPYTPEELGLLEEGIRGNLPLSRLESLLKERVPDNQRSAAGIARKLGNLSRKDPAKLNPERIKDYLSEAAWISTMARQSKKGKKLVGEFLRARPGAYLSDLEKAGLYWALMAGYGSMTAARKALGIPPPPLVLSNVPPSLAARRERLLRFLWTHPNATSSNGYNSMSKDVRQTYGNIHAARIAAGIVPDMHVLSVKAAELFNLHRQSISYYFLRGKLDGVRVAGRVYVSLISLEGLLRTTGKY